jgi:hypothetical protein
MAVAGASNAQDAVPAADALQRGRAAVEDQRYDDAVEAVRPLLEDPNPRRRAHALEITAVVRLIEGRPTEAQGSLAKLYELAPGFRLNDPSLPPRVTTAFEAEAAKKHLRAVTPVLRPSAGDTASFMIVAGGETARVDVSCRALDVRAYAPVLVSGRGGSYRFRLPTMRPHRCYAVALDRNDLALGRIGDAKEPFEVRPSTPAPEPAAITSRWWFWTGVGAAVLGGAAIAIVATRRDTPAPPAAEITASAKPMGLGW